MDDDARLLQQLMEESLSFEYQQGAVTPLDDPHTTKWRTLPCLISAQVTYLVKYEIADRGRQNDVQPGEVLLVPPGIRHNLTKISPGPGTSRWSHVNFRVFTSVDLFTLIDPPLRIQDPGRAVAIGEINARLVPIAQNDAPTTTAIETLSRAVTRKALGLDLLRLILGVSMPRPRAFEVLRAAQRLSPALVAIDRDLAMPPRSVDALSTLVNLSRSRMQTLFHDAFGMSPMRYLRHRRLERSRQLLLTTDLAIGAVATQTGFTDQFHFSRAFKSEFGSSPLSFRQRVQQAIS